VGGREGPRGLKPAEGSALLGAREDEHAGRDENEDHFGFRPAEQVLSSGGNPRRPDVRTRVSSMALPGGLDFEPEVSGQERALGALLGQAPAPQSGLAFEPEEGGARDRLSARHAANAAGPGQEDLASLLRLAAGEDAATDGDATRVAPVRARPPAPIGPREGAAAIPPPLDAAAGQTAFRGRSGVSGDIEAELFGPGSGRFAQQAAPAPQADAPPPAPALGPPPGASPLDGAGTSEDEPPTKSVASVFLSERVLGKRRRRKTSGLFRRSGHFRAVANRWVHRAYLTVRQSLRSVDDVTGKVRVPLANIFWAVAIAAISLVLGLSLPYAGGILAGCLILTIAGQPARNLVGIAGIMILSASLAEVVRQRERFLEIFLDLFG